MATHYVKIFYHGDIMGDEKGVPCHSLKFAKSYASDLRDRHGVHLITKIIDDEGVEIK